MAMKTSRLTKAVLAAVLGLSLSGGGLTTTYASDADAELAALELELATLEAELAQEKGTIKEEKTKLKKEPNKLALSGDARIKYTHTGDGANWYARGRIAMKHDINDTVSVYVRWALMNNNPLGLSGHSNNKINTYNGNNYANKYRSASFFYPDLNAADGSWVSDANMQVKKFLGADKVTIGRFGQTFGATGMMGDEDAFGGIDGAKFDWSGKAGALTVGYAKFGATQQYPEINTASALTTGLKYVGTSFQRKPIEQALFVNGQVKLGSAVTLHGMWLKEMNNGKSKLIATGSPYTPYYYDNPNDHDLRGIGITAQITPNLKLVGDYVINACGQSAYLADNAQALNKSATAKPTTDLVNSAKQNYKKYDFDRQKSEYISLRYKEAKWGDKGSFGINLDWRNIDPSARMDAYFTYVDFRVENDAAATISNEYYTNCNSLYNNLSIADDILASEGIKGPVLGFNYMITKNVKLSVLQTFAGSYNYYNLDRSYSRAKKGTKYNYSASADYSKINEKAPNMTVIAITAKF